MGNFSRELDFIGGNSIREKLKPTGISTGTEFRVIWLIKYIIFVPRDFRQGIGLYQGNFIRVSLNPWGIITGYLSYQGF